MTGNHGIYNHICVDCFCRYGGIQLHGDRFKHINNVARILLQETGVGSEVIMMDVHTCS